MKRSEFAESVIEGMQEVLKNLRGEIELPTYTFVIEEIDVKAIRKELRLTRKEFAQAFGFNVKTLQHWEQGLRRPTGAARTLLKLLQKDPIFVSKALLTKEKQAYNYQALEMIKKALKLLSTAESELKKKNVSEAKEDISMAKQQIKKLESQLQSIA